MLGVVHTLNKSIAPQSDGLLQHQSVNLQLVMRRAMGFYWQAERKLRSVIFVFGVAENP